MNIDFDDELPEDSDDSSSEKPLHEHFRFLVDKGQRLMRIDKFLDDRMINISRTKIQQGADDGLLRVNDVPVKASYKVKPNDVITILMAHPKRSIEIIPEDIPLKVVFEDEYLLVVNKEPGMVVHPAYGHYSGTLVNALAWHFEHLPLFQKTKENIRPGLVHRIDKDTSGLLLVAKTEFARSHLSIQFLDHSIDRLYHALVWGNFKEPQGTITGHIGRNLKDRRIMDVFPDASYGKHAVTHYRMIENLGFISWIELKLETGRTHQIRAHMQHTGHPLFNDREYGGDQILKGSHFISNYTQFVEDSFRTIPRQALHAKTLGFTHPVTGERLNFDSDLPADFAQTIEKWKTFVTNNS